MHVLARKTKAVNYNSVISGPTAQREVNHRPFDKWEKIYSEVNAFKHDPTGRAAGRTVAMSDAIESFEQMLNLLNESGEKLAAQYQPAHGGTAAPLRRD
jgi:hypothetical protein